MLSDTFQKSIRNKTPCTSILKTFSKWNHIFSLQLAKALTENDAQQHQRDEEWESYKQTRLGDTSGLTE